jgi:hypothetical protein
MSEDKFHKPVDAATRLSELREGKKTAAPEGEPAILEADEIEEGSFSTVSADRQQKIMLVLWFKERNAKAKTYSYLTDIDFDPSDGIVLKFVDSEVRITGQNLEPLFLALTAWRVQSIHEVDELIAEATLGKDATVVTGIEVKDRNE